jgi:large subunit ribosomal protein L28
MARVCEICGKGRSLGNSVETRGKAKYLGGVGTKITGITRRTFLPNLQNVRTTTANGTSKTVRVCTQCVRSGAIRKQVRNTPFKVAHDLETAPIGKTAVPRKKSTKKVAEKKQVADKTMTKKTDNAAGNKTAGK